MSCEVILEVVEEVYELLEVAEKGDPGPSNHQALENLQGGTVTERYHLTAAEVAEIAANTSKVSFPEAPNDGKQYGREALAWSEVLGNVGPWELVEIAAVSISAVQEILFDNLDFDTYDYNLSGVIELGGADSSNIRWYATEASAAAVVTGDYISNASRVVFAIQDSQTLTNHLIWGNPNCEHVSFENHIFYLLSDGTTWLSGANWVAKFTLDPAHIGVGVNSRNTVNTNSPTHLGIYHLNGANLLIGTRLILSRRVKS